MWKEAKCANKVADSRVDGVFNSKIVVSSIAAIVSTSPKESLIYLWHDYPCTTTLSATCAAGANTKDKNQKFLFFFKGGFDASTILGNDSRYLENLRSFLEPVINSSVRSRFVRCWHAKEDGWAGSTFHGNCDDKGPTVTIIQVGSFIFGGYSDVTWKSPVPGEYMY